MPDIVLRAMEDRDRPHVALLVCQSTNQWYQAHARPVMFHDPAATLLYCQVYEDLDRGCCVIAEDRGTRRLMGSCFYHPRPTHVSLGIMNVDPDCFGLGVAHRLLSFVTAYADRATLPVHLLSSAMNLDSFSLYTRAGFVPRAVYQDMVIPPEAVKNLPSSIPGCERIRPARAADVPAIAALEKRISHIVRDKDFRYLVDNADGIWHMSVLESSSGGVDGFLASVAHPAANMLGPGAASDEAGAAALLLAELRQHPLPSPIIVVPADAGQLVQTLYTWGARNCELHLCQVRGPYEPFDGVVMPSFMPETG